MKLRTMAGAWLAVVLGLSATEERAAASSTVFSYGARLTDGSSLATGSYDFRFELYDAATAGNRIGPTLVRDEVGVTNGVFTVDLDFGEGAISGDPRWLEIEVRPGASTAGFTVLSPRQSLSVAPYSLYAASAGSAAWTNLTGGLPDSLVGPGLVTTNGRIEIAPGAIVNPMLAEGAVTRDKIASGQVVYSLNGYRNDVSLVPGANIRLNPADIGPSINVIDVWRTAGNAGTTTLDFVGTTDGQALRFRTANTLALTLEPTSGTPNVIAGSGANGAPFVVGAAIGGGGSPGAANLVTDSYGTISGGQGNLVGNNDENPNDGLYASVGGGVQNQAVGEAARVGGGNRNQAVGELSMVAGGGYNRASGYAATISGGGGIDQVLGPLPNVALGYWSVIGGGSENVTSNNNTTISGGGRNQAMAQFASIGGGRDNRAAGEYATVPGGQNNAATGRLSLAAGSRAKAEHDGAFVWSDASGSSDFSTQSDHEFAVRATGGVRFVTSSSEPFGVKLQPGDGSWSSLSDVNAKTNFAAVDAGRVLEAVAQLPIQTWNYKSQDSSVRHLGPTAQDFSAAFGLGADPRFITSSDADGIALLAIQELYQELRAARSSLSERAAQVLAQERRLSEQAEQLEQLQRRLEQLERVQSAAPAKH